MVDDHEEDARLGGRAFSPAIGNEKNRKCVGNFHLGSYRILHNSISTFG